MGLWAWLDLEPRDVIAFAVFGLVGFLSGFLVADPTWGMCISILVSYHLFLGWLVITGDQEAGLSQGLFVTICTHLACVFLMVALGMGRGHLPFFRFFRYGIAALALFERKWLFSISRYAPKYEGPIDLLKPRQERNLVMATSTLNADARPLLPKPIQQQATPGAPRAIAVASLAQPQTAASAVQPQAAAAAPQTKPAVIAPKLQPVKNLPKGSPAMVRDTSIADSIRRKPAEGDANAAPILNATADDHEAWLRERATQNPTHRKPGVSVKDEYEQWLKARFKARGSKASAR